MQPAPPDTAESNALEGLQASANPQPSTGKPQPPSKLRVPALDGLRGIAILLVLLYHTVFATYTVSPVVQIVHRLGHLSWSGVDLFFVLSGFLIGGILLDTKDSPRYFKTFYIRRAYRILPIYAAIVAAYVVWLIVFRVQHGQWGDASVAQVPLWTYLTFTQNLWTACGWTELMVCGVTWSLAVEEQFYLTLPALIRKISRPVLTWMLVSVVIAAPLLRIIIHLIFKNGNVADYVLMPCRADTLCLGVLVALLVRTPRLWNAVMGRPTLVYWIAGIAVIGPAWLTYRGFGMFDNVMVEVGYSLLALFYTSCLLLALTAKGIVRRVLHNRALRHLGTLSYCVYLIHMSLIEGVRRVLALRFGDSTRLTHVLSLVIGIALVLAVAQLSWKFFEQPMLRRGHAYKY
jgi:peptidoglycan/LPS O-acetylase OafA/YrhL